MANEPYLDELDPELRMRLRGEVTHGRTVAEWATIDATAVHRRARRLIGWLLRIAFRPRTHGSEHVPAAGAFILCPNHSSWIDGFIQILGQHRVMHAMGKTEVFQLGPATRFLIAAGTFPVVRGGNDLHAREIARLLLERGVPVLIYPEGTRKGHEPGKLGRPHAGAALLALQTGVPVVPAASAGIRRWGEPRRLHWPKVTTVYGAPISFEGPVTPERVAAARDELWARVHELREEAVRRNAQR